MYASIFAVSSRAIAIYGATVSHAPSRRQWRSVGRASDCGKDRARRQSEIWDPRIGRRKVGAGTQISSTTLMYTRDVSIHGYMRLQEPEMRGQKSGVVCSEHIMIPYAPEFII